MDGYRNVMGGKLSLKAKGIPTKAKKSKKKRKDDGDEVHAKKRTSKKVEDDVVLVPITGKTAAQMKHEKFKSKREEDEIKKNASKTYRERVEEYSQYLGNLTEHHDVPRVSAAGNG
ncbi:hypothetical protein ACHHYP_05577 [Achlya hypogyna]|uniref:DUF1754-domain-containing protein n=1 Tax=Achlya hypogyna TaxID=1202772 RepID=A0A1V9YXG3_ACHHY|nr:hypothetical protein ACHHYP_05577 [Achlya hypogyna]